MTKSNNKSNTKSYSTTYGATYMRKRRREFTKNDPLYPQGNRSEWKTVCIRWSETFLKIKLR